MRVPPPSSRPWCGGSSTMRACCDERSRSMTLDPRERLIVALDVASVGEAQALVERLGASVSFYKIGYQLGFAGGLALAEILIAAGNQIFLDMKLHDIGHSVARGVESIARMG